MPPSADRWTPLTENLPTPEELRLVPELEGVEHNPVFRRTIHRRRVMHDRYRTRTTVGMVGCGSILLASVVFGWSKAPSIDNMLNFYLVFVATPLLMPRVSEVRPETVVGGLSVQEWADLDFAGVAPREAAVGYWATQFLARARAASPPGDRRTRLLRIGLVVGGIGGVILGSGLGPTLGVLLLVPGAALFAFGVVSRADPFGSLRELRFTLAQDARYHLGGFTRGEVFRRRLRLLPFGIVFVVLYLASGTLPPLVAAGWALLIGGLLGVESNRRARVDRTKEFEGLTDDIRRVLERATSAIHFERSR